MTKQEFLSEMCFTIGVPTYKGASTYSYQGTTNGLIMRQSRSSIDNRVFLDEYECNVPKIGSKSFTAFTYVMNKRVTVKYKFENLIPYKEVAGE